jgi:iron complex transport system substrate-binding protein
MAAFLTGACRSTTTSPTAPRPPSDAATTTSVSSSTNTTATPITVPEADVSFPITVDSDLGQLTIDRRPSRIVSLSASHTEMLYAVGAGGRVVGTDLTSNHPPEAQSTPKVDAFSFSIEDVVALEPDLVILAFDFQGEAQALAAVEIPFLLLGPPATLEGAFAQLITVGAATGHLGEASRLAQNLEAGVTELADAAAPIQGVTFYHEVDELLYSATSDSFIGDLYRRLGLVNIADRVDPGGPYPQLSAEFIVAEDPEFIFLADANFGVTIDLVEARPGWDTLRAVRRGNVVELDGDVAGRWGPRTVDLMAFILRAVERGLP